MVRYNVQMQRVTVVRSKDWSRLLGAKYQFYIPFVRLAFLLGTIVSEVGSVASFLRFVPLLLEASLGPCEAGTFEPSTVAAAAAV
jgi:hypothetical protein